MRIGQRAVGHLDDDVVNIVAVKIRGSLEIRRRGEGQDARVRVDDETGCICAPTDGVGQRRDRIRIGRRDSGDCRAILRAQNSGCREPAIRRDGRRFIAVDDRDRDGLGGHQASVRGLNLDVVDIVGTDVGRRLEIWSRHEAERAGGPVDDKARRVRAADDRIAERRPCIGIDTDHHRHSAEVFGQRDRRARPCPVGGDDRRLVEIGDRDGKRLRRGQRSVRGLNDDVVDVVGAGIDLRLEVRTCDEAQHT